MVNRTEKSGPDLHAIGKEVNNRVSLPERVAQWYYKHGLFLSSYPTCASSIAIIVVLFSCYPLLHIPLPGTIPTRVILPYATLGESNYGFFALKDKNFSLVKNILNINNVSFDAPFPWAQSSPYIYVQQVVLRSSVDPWTKDLRLMDAFRTPLYQVFKLLEIIRNHEDPESKQTLDHICLHVESVKRRHLEQLFPEYNCLILSPANFWKQDLHNFNKDPDILNTIFQNHNLQKTKVSITEMLFGLPMQTTGVKRYPIRTRSRVIQYAVTLILQKADEKYLHSLREKLYSLYPLHQTNKMPDKFHKSSVMYVYYPSEFKLMEFLPIFTAFIILFTYVYFSVRKIEVVRSRLILAIFAVLTVLGSLMMSLGLCFFFGLTISLQSKGIFPYLVILVGLENSLVITKSIVTTDETFDVKIRVAQGLSKEGWPISKTLLTEITILTAGLATFVPVIQEFCVFAIVGLISDFFLQMLLFSTILAMDIKRVEYTVEAKQVPKIINYSFGDAVKSHQHRFFECNYNKSSSMYRSQSHPKLIGLDSANKLTNDVINRKNIGFAAEKKIPKRLRLVNFWTRTRFFQRAFMIWMVVWICSIVYNSEFLKNFFVIDGNSSNHYDANRISRNIRSKKKSDIVLMDMPDVQLKNDNYLNTTDNSTEELKKLQYPDFEVNYYLSNFHWSNILKQYNISLSGKYVTILPTIKLSHSTKPEMAVLLRHPNEKSLQNFQWNALAAALDPLDFNDKDNKEYLIIPPGGIPLYPKSPMEIFLAIVLCSISVFVLTYTMVVFYRCICTRNYAEWRSSWNDTEVIQNNTQQILEGIPIQVDGHKHRIECLVSDGFTVVSSCLEGKVKVWDTKSGELLSQIDRGSSNLERSLSTDSDRDASLYITKMRVDLKSHDNVNVFRTNRVTCSIWCLDYFDNLIVIGCADGRLEFWETPTGYLKCVHYDDKTIIDGVTNIHLQGDRVIAARLSGRLDFYRLGTFCKGKQIDWGFTAAYRRTHTRTGSTGSIGLTRGHNSSTEFHVDKEEMTCSMEDTRIAHQQPITCMKVVNGIILTGSQDHSLRVYSLHDCNIEYALHGHYGPITAIFIDPWQPGTGGSGSQDGLLCVWDLSTRACMYSIQAHDGSITSLVCSPSYVISLGTDERVCVWERFQGNLLNTFNITHTYSSLLMLTPSLLVTSKSGSLIVWDLRTGEPTREVKLDRTNTHFCPKTLLLASSSVVCDYGNELRIVQFPIVNKCD